MTFPSMLPKGSNQLLRSQGGEDRRSPEEAASTRSDFAPNAWWRLEYARAAIEFRHDHSTRAGERERDPIWIFHVILEQV